MKLGSLLSQTSLVFDGFNAPRTLAPNSFYSKHRINVEGTIVKLDGGVVSIKGLSDQKYLLCFREGNLLFPSHPADQHSEHELHVEEGDLFIWTRLDWQPASFQNDIYTDMTEDKVCMSDSYSFVVSKSASPLSQVKSMLSPWRVILLGVMLVFFASATVLLFSLTYDAEKEHMNQLVSDCMESGNHAYRDVIFESKKFPYYSHLYVEEDKNDCQVELPFNWSEHASRVMECLKRLHPNHQGGWNVSSIGSLPFYERPGFKPILECSISD